MSAVGVKYISPKLKPPTTAQITTELMLRIPRDIPGCLHWRNNTGVARADNRFVPFGMVGSADMLVVLPPRGRLAGVEVKGPGDRQSVIQAAWELAIQRAGGVYVLAEKIKWGVGDRGRLVPDVSGVIARLREACG